ncbi:hypothetical protein HDU97_008812 [Phlyctochytrium planicorne]|nr:hypothetical protein HDU97_008812 [Phlyctochytrium planicorne]
MYPQRTNSNNYPQGQGNFNGNGYYQQDQQQPPQQQQGGYPNDGQLNISGPLALGGGFPTPSQLGRRPTNFGLQTSGSSTSLTSLNTDLARRPSTVDPSTPLTSAAPMSFPPNSASIPPGMAPGGDSIGLPTPARNQNAPVKSLFQSCMSLIEKLYGFPLFEFYLFPDGVEMFQTDPPPLIDPVAILWGCFRLGAPLCMLYNQLNPRTPLNVSDVSSIRPPKYTNVCKDNVYHFIVACKNDLGLSEKDVFSISELYKDDTNGFVKVMKTVNTLVEKIESRGALPPRRPLPFQVPTQEVEAPTDNRSKLVNELIDTERKYIHDLEALQNYQKEIIHQNIMTRDGVHAIFANLDELLDFQRRFLIAMESTLSLPTNEQRIGQLFIMNKLSNMIPPHMLQSYLIKPVQRVCKYPLLLQELVKLSQNTSYPYIDELKDGLDSMKRVTDRVNEQKRVEENRNMKSELIDRVEDWKGLVPNDFGELLLTDRFPMTSNDTEREYNLYLFERILLCCKDLGKSKRKSKKNDKDAGPPQYALKGNIYINSIEGVQDTSDATIGVFGVKVFWRDVADLESFSLKCRNEEQVKLWKERLEKQVELDKARRGKPSAGGENPNPLGLLYGSNGQMRGVGSDQYSDSGYGGSNFRPSLDGRPSFDSNSSGFQSPALARSRSIPHNYYPQQLQQQQPPPGASPQMLQQQRKSQLAMSRGFGSQQDLGYFPGQRSSPDPGAPSNMPPQGPSLQGGRGGSPPPVPQLPPHMMMPTGHQRFASEGSLGFMNQPDMMGPPSPLMARQQSQGALPQRLASYPNYPQPGPPPPQGNPPAGYFRNGSGQAGVNLPAPPTRTLSATAAALAAAASGGPPPAGYSDDDLSDDEYYAAQQQRQRIASQQMGPAGFARFNDSPTPQSPKMSNGNPQFSQQRRSQHQYQQQQQQQNGNFNQRGPAALGGLPNINTSRKQSIPGEDPSLTGGVSPVTPGNPFAAGGWRGPPPPSHPPPPVPPIPQQHAGGNNQYARSASVPELDNYGNPNGPPPSYPLPLPSTSPPTSQFLQNGQQQMRQAFSPGLKPGSVQNAYNSNGQGGSYSDAPPSASSTSRSPSMAPMQVGYQGVPPKPGPMGGPPTMPLPLPPSAGPSGGPPGPPPSMPLPMAPPNMRRAPTAPLPSTPPIDNNNPPPSAGPPSANPSAGGGTGYFKVRTHYKSDIFVIAIPFKGATYAELQERIERKIRLCGAQSPADLGRTIKIRYKDDDEDMIAINGNEDVALAFDLAKRSVKERGVLRLYVE